MDISVIHPSRNRPDKAYECFLEWSKKSNTEFEYILSLDTDEPQKQKYCELFHNQTIVFGNNSNVVEAMNNGASNSTGDILVCISDDFGCSEGWDSYILAQLDKDKEQALIVNDGHKECLMMTIPILTKKLYNKLGYVYHPSFTGMFADNALAEICDKMGVLVKNRDLEFPHRHWLYGHYTADSTNKRHDNPEGWRIGQKVIKKLRDSNYGL